MNRLRIGVVLLFLGLAFSAHAQPAKHVDVQAHQGGAGLYPSNCIPAFLHAVKLGVTTLELDCVISKDSLVVVSHDPFMRAATMLTPAGEAIVKEKQEEYALFQMPYDSIRRYQLGVKFDPEFPQQQRVKTYKPLLSEVIDSVETYIRQHRLKPVRYNIEIKSYKPEGFFQPAIGVFVDLLVDVLKEKKIEKRVFIQSFDVRPLQYVKQHYPSLPLSYLLSKNTPYTLQQHLDRLGFTPQVLSPEHPLVTRELVEEARHLRMAVIPWTVDQAPDQRRLLQLGVDGIITNYPDRLLHLSTEK
jgi:glycerophosphoryl diester phosphodiesterase